MSYYEVEKYGGVEDFVVVFVWNLFKKVINFYLDLVEVVLVFVFLNLIIFYVVDNE